MVCDVIKTLRTNVSIASQNFKRLECAHCKLLTYFCSILHTYIGLHGKCLLSISRHAVHATERLYEQLLLVFTYTYCALPLFASHQLNKFAQLGQAIQTKLGEDFSLHFERLLPFKTLSLGIRIFANEREGRVRDGEDVAAASAEDTMHLGEGAPHCPCDGSDAVF